MKKISLYAVLAAFALAGGGAYGVILHGQGEQFAEVHPLLPALDGHTLVRESHAAVVGTISGLRVSEEASFIRDGEIDVVTTATIEVEEFVSNPNGLTNETVLVRVIGGEVDGKFFHAEGSPSLKEGERVLVFLNETDGDYYTIYGWAQGKFHVADDGTIGSEAEKGIVSAVFGNDVQTLSDLRRLTEVEGR